MASISYVSIPHRYAENILKTDIKLLHQVFQFLIGTLKTAVGGLLFQESFRFQFLIGTLKTYVLKFILFVSPSVSIPHRYAENQYVPASPHCFTLVSIPHRYAENEFLAISSTSY